MPDKTPSFSPESSRCGLALRSRIVRSSRDCGWSSVLLDHHHVDPTYDEFATRPTPDQTIVVMLSRAQTLEALSGGRWRAASYHPGTIGMTPGGTVDRLRRRRRHGQGAFEKANLYVPQQLLREAFEHYRRAGQADAEQPLEALAFQDPLIVQTVSSLLQGMQTGLPDIYAQTAACWLATHLLAVHSPWRMVDGGARKAPKMTGKRLDAVREMVRTRYAEPLSLADLAAEARISKFHFARLFRQQTGTTPHAHILQVRLQAACRLLTETDLRVKQIAARTGFGNVASLGAAFARKQGVTPTAFRRLFSAEAEPDGRRAGADQDPDSPIGEQRRSTGA